MNVKNPAIKRILADLRELEKHPSSRYYAVPLEENLFEWHFTIRGPNGSHFEGGIYHGRSLPFNLSFIYIIYILIMLIIVL
jgi:ubiquitin-conjugating enzyme E2 J1